MKFLNQRRRAFARIVCLVPGLLCCLSACSTSPKRAVSKTARDNGFVAYYGPRGNSGLKLAVKDNIDLKGTVTTAGSRLLAETGKPAAQDAPLMLIARERGVPIVGKTNMTEFAVTVSGENEYFGTPKNIPKGAKTRFIPGGSSSGSAVAVASRMADVAFGTDTGGSIRVPAACCGIFGLKTTFGLVSTKGVFPISPVHLDTVGPLARNIPHLVEGMSLLQRGFEGKYQAAVAAKPSAKQIKIGRLYLNGTDPAINKVIDETLAARGFKVVYLNPEFRKRWEQADKDGETIALGDAWQNDRPYAGKSGVSRVTRLVIAKGALDYATRYPEAVARKPEWQSDLAKVFKEVDFIAVPTLQSLPPRFPFWGSNILFEMIVFNSQNTVGINFSGNPALAIPVPMPVEKNAKTFPYTSLQLVGKPRSEAALINAARLITAQP